MEPAKHLSKSLFYVLAAFTIWGEVAQVISGNAALAQESTKATVQPLVASPIPDTLVDRLPLPYREIARRLLTLPAALKDIMIEFYAGISDDEWRGLALGEIARQPEGVAFLKAQLDKEATGQIRAQILLALEKYFAEHSQDQAALEKRISSDPDATAAVTAVQVLQRIQNLRVGELLEKRLQSAQGGDTSLKTLRDEYLAHYMWYGEIRLPDFAYAPPPVFQVKPAGQFVRVLGFGDFGDDSTTAQVKTAAAMRSYHREHPFDFGITMGDNFYPKGPLIFGEHGGGLSSPEDPRWRTMWEDLYGPMGIKFYPSIGNGDYFDDNGLAAELAYTRKSQTWFFPAPYYTYTAGSIQFFAIDNIRLSDDELHWLDEELAKSKSRWKVVYGHYPIHTYAYTSELEENSELIARLLPILRKNSVDVSLAGHNHELQELPAEGSLHFFVSGGGGATSTGAAPTYKGSTFKTGQHGFSVIEADERHLNVIFVNENGKELHRSHITK